MMFLIDIYDKKTRKFIKRLTWTEEYDKVKTELEAIKKIEETVLKEDQYYVIRVV